MRNFILLLTGCVMSANVVAANRVNVGLFSEHKTDGWSQKEFAGETRYELQKVDGRFVLAANSEKAASAYYKKIKVDLEKTPFLNWSWSKQLTIEPGNETEKSGDDFVARIYVIKNGGLFFWKTLAINYVWSYQHKKGQSWDNPFAGKNAIMVSQRDAATPENTWHYEKRNILQDFEQLHAKKITRIDGVAIMTDSDNSGLKAEALYGDIYFTAE